MNKDYLNLILVSYNFEEYIKEFGGYYAGIFENHIIILLDNEEINNHTDKFVFEFNFNFIPILNKNKFNGFDDYSIINNECIKFTKLYYKSFIHPNYCRKIYLND